MPIVADWPSLEIAREQLTYCREEIILGTQAMRANTAPSLADVHLMCDAVLEYFGAQKALEAGAIAAPVDDMQERQKHEGLIDELAKHVELVRGLARCEHDEVHVVELAGDWTWCGACGALTAHRRGFVPSHFGGLAKRLDAAPPLSGAPGGSRESAAEATERPSVRAESTLEALQAYRDLRDGTIVR
jgi:hypothetical protein